MGRRELLEAEMAVVELEDELAAAKEYAMDGTQYRDVKERLREARRVFRTLREGDDPGEGVARPATVSTGVEV
jgi:hypothetical protein